jgi:hypothetical protein
MGAMPSNEMATRNVGTPMLGVVAIAVLLHAYVALTEWTNALWAASILLWALFPYAAAVLVALATRRAALGVIPGVVALLLDVWLVYSVRSSSSSTAAIAFLWMPLWNLIIVLVLGIGGALVWKHLLGGGSRAT